MIVAGMEICNAYNELNDPTEQRERFRKQSASGVVAEADERYCAALEHGLPPTVGWGMGLDRMCMLLTDSTQIRETVLFPLTRSG